MKKTLLTTLLAVSAMGSAQITTSSSYTPAQLVNDVLVSNSSYPVTNITSSSAIDFGTTHSLGYFNSNGSDFPFEEGIILSTGDIANAPGPNITTQSSGGWGGDNYLTNMMMGANSQNATSIQFDFVATGNALSLDFIFASEEYGTFQCGYGDAFAIILTDLSTNFSQNLGIIPGTTIPVSVTTIRNEQYNGSCGSANPEYFEAYYSSSNAAAPINFNGVTVPMSAEASLNPGTTYRLKIAIADRADSTNDSALFIASGVFMDIIGDLGTPVDIDVCDENNDGTAVFDLFINNTEILGNLDPADFTITYHESLADAENDANSILNPEAYTNITAPHQEIYARVESNSADAFATVPFLITAVPVPVAGNVETDIIMDDDEDAVTTIDLSVYEDDILNGAFAVNFDIIFYATEFEAMTGVNPFPNNSAFTQSATFYFSLVNAQTGCFTIGSFNIVVLPSDYETPQPDGLTAQTFTPGQTLADLEVEGQNIQWYPTAGSATGRNTNDNDDTPLPLTTLLENNTTYYASQTIYNIESIDRLPVTVTEVLSTTQYAFTGLQCYPNPVKDVLTITNNEDIEHISIYNILGQNVLNREMNDGNTDLNLSFLKTGMYIIKVTSKGSEKIFNIVKE